MTNRERTERLARSVDRCLAIMRGDLLNYRIKLDEMSARVAELETRLTETEAYVRPYRELIDGENAEWRAHFGDGPMTIEAG